MAMHMGDTKSTNWIYLICTVVQTLLAIFGLFSWHHRNKKEDERLEEERKAKEQQKTNPEKVASVLYQKYDNVEMTFCNFKRNVNRLKDNVIVDGITEFHVLLHICNPVNRAGFDKSNQTISEIEKISKLFVEFRIHLSSIHEETCPREIIEEFSDKIMDIAQTIFPFVSNARKEVIQKVLKYFFQELGEKDTLLKSIANYRDVIPYIDFFKYKNGEMACEIECRYSCVKNLEACAVMKAPDIVKREDDILQRIRKVWPGQLPDGNLLHVVRTIMFHLSQNPEQREYTVFIDLVKTIMNTELTMNGHSSDTLYVWPKK